MAGIGFELRKTLRRRSYTAYVRAYAAALAYSSGPWICTIIALALIFTLAKGFLGQALLQQFNITVVYIYAFSLLLTGPIQIVTTRFVADKMYAKQEEEILPGVATALTFTAVLAGLIGLVFSQFSELPVAFEISGVVLFVIISCLWTMMSYISCLKQYRLVVWSFAVGAAVSVIAAIGLCEHAGLDMLGLIWGYALGHLVILLSLMFLSRRQSRGGPLFTSEFFAYFRRYPSLVVTGLLINLVIWVDKFTVWAFRGEHVWAGFVFYARYDIPAYLAYLSVMPSLALFLIKVETSFAEKYAVFTRSLIEAPREIIVKNKADMVDSMRQGLVQLLKFQAVVSTVVFLLAEDILKVLHLSALSTTLFRILLVGAFFHFTALHALVFLMYLDRRRMLLGIFLFFALSSFIFTLPCVWYLDTPYLAVGYVVATFLTAILAMVSLFRVSEDIDCAILFRQPLFGPSGKVVKFRACSPDCYRGKTIYSRATGSSSGS